MSNILQTDGNVSLSTNDDSSFSPAQSTCTDDVISDIGAQLDGNVSFGSTGSSSDPSYGKNQPIPVYCSERRNVSSKTTRRKCHNKTVKRSNKAVQALDLPSVLNLNPRSVYNKVDEFHSLVNELQVDLLFMSESWERENQTLDQIIELENYQIISNVHQRTGRGGRPALIINNSKYHVENLTNTFINIPWGVEITWALLTPKHVTPRSIVKKIAVASIYSKPNSVRKTLLLDHIADSYHLLNSKYQSGLFFILAGDTNELKLDSILNLSPNLKQLVSSPTRLDPERILDPIITDLSKYYQIPVVLPPLDNDPDKDGSPSDHLMPFMEPINSFNNNPARRKKVVTFRPMPRSGIEKMGKWIVNEDWSCVINSESAHDKATVLHNLMMKQLNFFLPEKTATFTSEDQPWVTPEIKDIQRRKKREYSKKRKSPKWKRLNVQFEAKCNQAKTNYYNNIVMDLKNSAPGQWYSKLKRMSNHDQIKSEEVQVEEISHLTNQEQADIIADNFSRISNDYKPLESSDIDLESSNVNTPAPKLEPHHVYEYLKKIKTNTSTVKDDIPASIIKEFAVELSAPVADIINFSVTRGEYANIWKTEMVTPVPKVYPPKKVNQLRKISGLKNLSKVTEKIIGDWMISDMRKTRDPTQYGNEKGISVNHYLIKMIDEILRSLDKNSVYEKFAVFCTMVDWRQAFDRQCPKLGIKSFIRNGVRKSLIPLLINYFQNRKMIVKWHGVESSLRALNGGGPQGALWGILEYLSQSNNNTDFISPDKKFKFIDDLSILEMVNLLSIGLSSYNFRLHVASDIPANGYFVDPDNMLTQQYMDKISKWTVENKMLLNEDKTQSMLFNFTKKFQFSSRVSTDNTRTEIVSETKLLGVIINDKLTWDSNTDSLVKKANARMRILHKLVKFEVPREDLKTIYILFIRSHLEQSCQVWHSNLTLENITDIERVQKNALRIILQDDYVSYVEALENMEMESLYDRRQELCLTFAKKCTKSSNSQIRGLFPKNNAQSTVETRDPEEYHVNMARTGRYKRSAVPFMQGLLNCSKK